MFFKLYTPNPKDVKDKFKIIFTFPIIVTASPDLILCIDIAAEDKYPFFSKFFY